MQNHNCQLVIQKLRCLSDTIAVTNGGERELIDWMLSNCDFIIISLNWVHESRNIFEQAESSTYR